MSDTTPRQTHGLADEVLMFRGVKIFRVPNLDSEVNGPKDYEIYIGSERQAAAIARARKEQ